MKNLFARFCVFALLIGLGLSLSAQEEVIRNREGGEYLFTMEKQLAATPVKSQDRTNTCWSFSTVSFMESELIRMGKGAHDLSEMFVVRHTYPAKAEIYVRKHGNNTLGPGGLFHDVNKVIMRHGIVPESVYSGKIPGQDKHVHGELDHIVKRFCEAIVENKNRSLSTRWMAALEGILDAYLGEVPENFSYRGKDYTPQSFATELGFNPDDYMEFMSFTNYPYYEKSALEIPDNWDWHPMYNLPLDEMMTVIDHALENGYTVAWDADVSEPTFSHGNGIAVIPASPWAELSADERRAYFQAPGEEAQVDAFMRQADFDNYQTTDDHLMHLTGLARDQHGSRYYLVKNSWGQNKNACGGYLFASVPYLRAKTIHVMLHKDAVPAAIRQKLK